MGISLLCGFVIGLEREYRNKSTGLRTVILICLGSTAFTIVSHHGNGTDDRIAANIITGIGFIGAGVIFKDKVGVLGLTTAAVIWVTAAIGMTAGNGEYSLALLLTAIVMVVLLFLGRLEAWVNTLPQKLLLTVTLTGSSQAQIKALEETVTAHNLSGKRQSITKEEGNVTVAIEIRGRARDITNLKQHLLEREGIQGFY